MNVVYKFKQFNRRDSTSQLFTLFEQKIPHTFADNLTSYLDKMDFFNAEKSTGEIMVDGDFFLIEGSSSHRYHIIERYHIEDKGLDSVLISLFYNANLIAESLGTDSVLSHVAKDRFKRLP